MPANEIIIAAAGGGKTTRIINGALQNSGRVALLTYTINNVDEIQNKLFAQRATVLTNVEVWSWYRFLLRELARPYQSELVSRRIDGICWVEGRSPKYLKRAKPDTFYLSDGRLIYSDKLAQFVCECNKITGGAVIRRLEQRFSTIYIDEIQDLAGYDLDLVEALLRTRIKLVLVGDHRQATFRTNNSKRNAAYKGIGIINKLKEWDVNGLGTLKYETGTYRCNQLIATFADSFFPKEPATISLTTHSTQHDGVFAIRLSSVEMYMDQYRPQVLRLDKTTNCSGYDAMNFGESKGLTFDRVLIFPHKGGQKWLSSGDYSLVSGSSAKVYVGVTRARHSVAFVFDGEPKVPGLKKYP